MRAFVFGVPSRIAEMNHKRAMAVSHRRIERLLVIDDGSSTREDGRDALVVEAPLELRAQGESLLVVMRTPGHDRELARGLLFAEGVIEADRSLDRMSEPADLPPGEAGNVLELGLLRSECRQALRSTIASSGCGVCGKISIADLEVRAQAVSSSVEVAAATIARLPETLRAAQTTFEETGGLHAAGAFDTSGQLIAIREDVGRHNAVDKLVGWALARARVPMSESVLCVSGRLSFEIIQKAVVAGFPVVVAVSAPSSLAVDLAERFRVTLCGFTRDARFNVYSHAYRIA